MASEREKVYAGAAITATGIVATAVLGPVVAVPLMAAYLITVATSGNSGSPSAGGGGKKE
jgi:hypothetical protein